MVESIERPHGDQVERIAAATAITEAMMTTSADMSAMLRTDRGAMKAIRGDGGEGPKRALGSAYQ